jgi:hypothetical protein
MKAYLVIIVFLLFKLTFAQEKEKIKPGTPINSGFVFIDGKYIEPPYTITLNNNELILNEYYININKKNEFTYSLPDTINTGMKFLTFKLPNDNEYFFSKVLKFYYSNYPKYQADNLIKIYISKLPFVKKTFYNDKGIFTVEWVDMTLPMSWIGVSNSISKTDLRKINKLLIKTKSYIENQLNKNNYVFIFSGNVLEFENKNDYQNFLEKGLPILKDTNIVSNQEIKKLQELNLLQNVNDTLPTKKIYYKKYSIIQNNNTIKETKNANAYSPINKQVTYINPAAYIPPLTNYQTDINIFTNKLNGYGYYIYTLIDMTNDQNADVTLDDWKNLNGSIIFIATHGDENGIILSYFNFNAEGQILANNYNQDGDLIVAASYININNQNVPFWVTYADENWFTTHWGNRFNQNNSILFLAICKGYNFLSTIGGGVFGYTSDVDASTVQSDFANILDRMNGNIQNGTYRTALSAYTNYGHSISYYGNGKDYTLCPAPKSKYPEDNATVGLQGSGWFEVDTYCDASIPINDQDFNNSPIAFEWTNPGLSITNVHWDDPDGDGLSNKIVFNWHSTSNNIVTVKINHN